MSVLQTNRAVRENVGREKVDRALAEVAGKLDPLGDNQPLLDRAYEIGLHHDWDGTIEIPEGLLIGGERIDAFVDLKAALNEDQAFENGHIDRATYDLGKRTSADAGHSDELVEPVGVDVPQAEVQPMVRVQFRYGWGTVGSASFNVASWQWAGSRTIPFSSTIRRHGAQGGIGPNRGQAGRIYYEFPGAGHTGRYWSNWRIEPGTPGISWADFGSNIVTIQAQMGSAW